MVIGARNGQSTQQLLSLLPTLRTAKDREHQLANDTQSCFSLAQKLVAASNAKQQKAIRLSATLCKTDQQVIRNFKGM